MPVPFGGTAMDLDENVHALVAYMIKICDCIGQDDHICRGSRLVIGDTQSFPYKTIRALVGHASIVGKQ